LLPLLLGMDLSTFRQGAKKQEEYDMVENIILGTLKSIQNAKTGTSGLCPSTKQPKPVQVQSATLPKLVRMANDLAAMGPPVDAGRIAEIRQAIATGNYPVNPESIANAILDFDGRGSR
jgi:flagellar biosynthesis anti-sigma factor FlgM